MTDKSTVKRQTDEKWKLKMELEITSEHKTSEAQPNHSGLGLSPASLLIIFIQLCNNQLRFKDEKLEALCEMERYYMPYYSSSHE